MSGLREPGAGEAAHAGLGPKIDPHSLGNGQDSPIKEMLFDFLESNRGRLDQMVSEGRYDRVAEEAVAGCLASALEMAPRAEALEALATGIIHYTLTRMSTPSHRKAEVGGVCLDVVIPGVRQLRQDPRRALVILVCCKCAVMKRRLDEAYGIQPVRRNVWVLTQDCATTGARGFTISGKDSTFPQMISEIGRFVRGWGQHRLGMAV